MSKYMSFCSCGDKLCPCLSICRSFSGPNSDLDNVGINLNGIANVSGAALDFFFEKKLCVDLRASKLYLFFFLFLSRYMWLWKGSMSREARLSVSVLLLLERVMLLRSFATEPCAVWIRGCYVSDRNVCVMLWAWSCLLWGGGEPLHKIFVGTLINLAVTQLLPSVMEGDMVSGLWVPCWVPRWRLEHPWLLAQPLLCPRLPPALPWAAGCLQQMFSGFSWKMSFSCVNTVSLWCLFLFSCFLIKFSSVCFFKGFKMPTLVLLTELKLVSDLPQPERNTVPILSYSQNCMKDNRKVLPCSSLIFQNQSGYFLGWLLLFLF